MMMVPGASFVARLTTARGRGASGLEGFAQNQPEEAPEFAALCRFGEVRRGQQQQAGQQR